MAAHVAAADTRPHAVASGPAHVPEEPLDLTEAIPADRDFHLLCAFFSTEDHVPARLGVGAGSIRLEQEPIERELELVCALYATVRLDFDRQQRASGGIDAVRLPVDLEFPILEGRHTEKDGLASEEA